MSENIKMEDIVEKPESTSEEAKVETKEEETTQEAETKSEESKQDPLKAELEKVKTSKYTEKEKAEYSLKKNAERLKELGGDPASILGTKEEPTEDDDQPVTKAELRKYLASNATKTALQLADEIANETERELVKHYLENRITPSGDANQDLKDARRMVNAIKNEQILEEQARKNPAKQHSNSTSAPAKEDRKDEGELEPSEMPFLKAPFNMTKAEILEARKKSQAK